MWRQTTTVVQKRFLELLIVSELLIKICSEVEEVYDALDEPEAMHQVMRLLNRVKSQIKEKQTELRL